MLQHLQWEDWTHRQTEPPKEAGCFQQLRSPPTPLLQSPLGRTLSHSPCVSHRATVPLLATHNPRESTHAKAVLTQSDPESALGDTQLSDCSALAAPCQVLISPQQDVRMSAMSF